MHWCVDQVDFGPVRGRVASCTPRAGYFRLWSGVKRCAVCRGCALMNADQNHTVETRNLIQNPDPRAFEENRDLLRLNRRRWRVTDHATIEKHLNFHTTILRASCRCRVFSYSFHLAVTHRRDEAAQGNFMIHRQVLDH
ncbi:hypothetical protein BH18ACI4_BH18ACI4_02800 [soil metagenome]